MAVRARFDDLTPGGESAFEFVGPGEVVVTADTTEVRAALRRVEELSREGWWLAGFVAYDAAPGFDPGLVVAAQGPSAIDVPLVWFAAFRERKAIPPVAEAENTGSYALEGWESEMSERDHSSAVHAIKEHIASGDTYQVNLTFRLRTRLDGDAFAFYKDLVLAQRGGYGAYLDTGDVVVASASPERFFKSDGDRILVKPMKGTIRRGRWSDEDEALRLRLARSEKDRAENIMIVDLLRNDVGRIARYGTVAPSRLLDVERYETVWQLTSEIGADLADGVGLADVFGALFPSGSVTGAPKMSTMEIIRSLETSARGIYCGAIGYVSPSGPDGNSMASFSVAIRTAVLAPASGKVEYGVGGGITWDSGPEAEYAEARLKADVLSKPRRPGGLLETIRWDPGPGYALLERHLDRLAASARYFAFPCDPAAARAALAAVSADLEQVGESRIVRLTLSARGQIVVEPGERLDPFSTPGQGGGPMAVAISSDPIDSADAALFHKVTDRRRYERRAAAHPDADDVLLVNERGEVTESTVANVAALIEGEWVTPPLESGCLPGTYRAELLASGFLREGILHKRDLHDVEVALFNSVRGWRSARLSAIPGELRPRSVK